MLTLDTVPAPIRRERAASAPSPAWPWQELAKRVRAFQPDVVVLVARKMPRLVELFGLDFGPVDLIVSDLAVPFSHRQLRDARVAVLDDVVNVGSTLLHAADSVRACGAREVELFCLARKSNSPQRARVNCILEEPLTTGEYERLVGSVPQEICQLAKPYDLVFPTIPCVFALPFRSTGEVIVALRDRLGADAVHCLTPQYERPGLARVTVTVPLGRERGNYKLRLYFNELERRCNVVPFAIPPNLAQSANAFRSATAGRLFERLERAVQDAPAATSLWPEEPLCQARLFATSLDLGLQMIDETLGDILAVAGTDNFDRTDAQMLFGPAAEEEFVDVAPLGGSPREAAAVPVMGQVGTTSPFLRHVGQHLAELAMERAQARDVLSIFKAIFDALAELVGAADPSKYQLDWPLTEKEIAARPYLRLRIGPSFDDLVALIGNLGAQKDNNDGKRSLPLRSLVSAMLDYAIDAGAVVPTLGFYEGYYFRIYRKGESEQRDRAADRVSYAWHRYGKPLSLTRCSKINVILAFSADLAPVLSPSSLLRGNAASLQATCLDKEEAEIARYLRDTGRLRPAKAASTEDQRALER